MPDAQHALVYAQVGSGPVVDDAGAPGKGYLNRSWLVVGVEKADDQRIFRDDQTDA